MKKRELETMRKQETALLEVNLGELKDKLTKVRIDMSVGQEKNLAMARSIKRDIAQMKTLIAEKQRKTLIAEDKKKTIIRDKLK